jgi:disulfide bond formation protein DsbB
MVGSLYLSDVKGFEPCVLCWYQRICMYSLIPVVITGILRKETKLYQYILPLSIIGIIISTYHNLLYTGIIKNEEFCSTGISCTSKYVEYFGFVTIPLMAFVGFAVIIGLSLMSRNYIKNLNK